MVGKLEKVPLKEVWKKEAQDFTPWLYTNIDVLSDVLDIPLTAIDKEKKVGVFFADITAEDSTGQRVIIENQLEKTDHSHLGQILTYVSNLDAKIAVWISSRPRPEHIQAVKWLNESGSGTDFYLIKMETYRIGESEPAPSFEIVAAPNEITKTIGDEKQKYAEWHKLCYDFWKSLLERAKGKTELHSNISPNKWNWISTGTGIRGMGLIYAITEREGRVEFYIDRGKDSKEENKKIYDKLYSHKKEIEKDFGSSLKWQRKNNIKNSSITKIIKGSGLKDPDKQAELQNKMIDAMVRLEEAFRKHINTLKKEIAN